MSSVQANDVNYELHSLGWKAFQNLCVTVVSEIWGQTVQSFFDSHDGGRDGAFQGIWNSENDETFSGNFTVQCKFTSKPSEQIKLADLKDEIVKARRLASQGLADNYFLFSNARLTGTNEENIRHSFESIPGLKKFQAYGVDWMSQRIRESSRLRMLVPRVYGLGDLSQIMDERAYSQAVEILGALGDDLSKFVITNAFQSSAKALKEHGFVLLLGEPACGKSTIAASLAVGALDIWGSSTIKICSPEDFTKHWNPKEPKQLFWVDDAFGATQVDWAKTFAWNSAFPHIQAAIKKGAKVIFTSRDYIYKKSRESLKETALPLIRESQVVINVQDITINERQQILYNHIKLGDQSPKFKTKIKPFLASVAEHTKFSPETARRLGSPLFTKSLLISKLTVDDFVAYPMDFLIEIIRTLDIHSRAALALIFMRGGALPSPVEISPNEEKAITLMMSSSGHVRSAFSPLDGSLLLKTVENGVYMWRYKHPTIRDAFASLVAEDSELMDIYLVGSPMDKIFSEIACGDLGIEGVKVVIPSSKYGFLINRIKKYDTSQWYNKLALIRFLTYKCDKNFLEKFLNEFPQFVNGLHIQSYLYVSSDIDLLVKLYQYKLLSEDDRKSAVLSIKKLAVETPDSGFTSKSVRKLITNEEFDDILECVRIELLENLENVVEEWKESFEPDNDPEEHFDELKSSLSTFRTEFENDVDALGNIDLALEDINLSIENLRSEYWQEPDSGDFFKQEAAADKAETFGRSIFDDVDA